MASVYRVTNTLAMKSGVAKDSAVNVHHVVSTEDGTVSEAAMASWVSKFKDFYINCIQSIGIGSNAIQPTTVKHKLTVAQVSTGEAGRADDVTTPILYEEFYAIPGVGATSLPPEVAICVSHSGYLVGVPEETVTTIGGTTFVSRPRARRRGRFYLGPLAQTAGTLNATTGVLEVNAAMRTSILEALDDLAVALTNNLEIDRRCQYGVYSPTSDTFYSIEDAWIDNAFDTVRRRGVPASGRQMIDINTPMTYVGDVSEVA